MQFLVNKVQVKAEISFPLVGEISEKQKALEEAETLEEVLPTLASSLSVNAATGLKREFRKVVGNSLYLEGHWRSVLAVGPSPKSEKRQCCWVIGVDFGEKGVEGVMRGADHPPFTWNVPLTEVGIPTDEEMEDLEDDATAARERHNKQLRKQDEAAEWLKKNPSSTRNRGPTSSPHYNDALDMDQQSPEFWDDVE